MVTYTVNTGRDAKASVAGAGTLRLRDVSKVYGTGDRAILALDKISYEVPGGQFVALLGPSGCGKSTLLRLVAGLDEPTSGEIQYVGPRGSARARSLPWNSMVFQDLALFPWKTVVENVTFGLKLHGIAKSERMAVAKRLIELTRLRGFEDKYPVHLSGGMQQRVALARALAMDTPVLLMDEPFASLDEQTRIVMQLEFLRVWEETNKTVLLVTHSIDEAVLLADRVIVLSSRPGRIADDFLVELDRPRGSVTRSDAQFNKYRDRIWDQIRDSVMKAS